MAYQILVYFVAYTDDAYVRSDLVAVAPQITGRIIAVHVVINQTKAQIEKSTELLKVAQEELNTTTAALAASTSAHTGILAHRAALDVAKAENATAQWNLDQTDVVSPADGAITNLTVQPGDTATINIPMIGIVDAHAWRIMANYKQDYVRSFTIGSEAWVWLDSQPFVFHRARITGIARGISRDPGIRRCR